MKICNNVNSLIDQFDCSGCGVCFNACPVNAIKFEYGENGYYRPLIDPDKCIECGSCSEHCELNSDNQFRIKQLTPNLDFNTYSIKDEFKLDSQSQGILYILGKYFIEERNGYVFGVKWNENLMPVFDIAHTIEELQEFRHSKYVQPNPQNIYNRVAELLSENKEVLFVGLPCHADGLLNYFDGNKPAGLCIATMRCQGTTNPGYWDNVPKKEILKLYPEATGFITRSKHGCKKEGAILGSQRESDFFTIFRGNFEKKSGMLLGLTIVNLNLNLIHQRCNDCNYHNKYIEGIDLIVGDGHIYKRIPERNIYNFDMSLLHETPQFSIWISDFAKTVLKPLIEKQAILKVSGPQIYWDWLDSSTTRDENGHYKINK